MTFSPLIIWAKALFFFEQLFPVVARTWLGEKSVCLFLGPKFRFLAQKSNLCHTTPILVDDPFLALDMTAQKGFPPPTVGVLSASKSRSALSAQALRANTLRARA